MMSYPKKEQDMNEEILISEKKIAKLSKKVAKTFGIQEEESLALIYEEWELVEMLFVQHKKVKAVLHHLVEELNYTYRIA